MAIRRVTRAGVGLAVGIIILGLLVWGGLWFVRERGDQARRQEAINIADQQLKSQSEQGIALNSSDTDKNADKNNQSSTDKNGDKATSTSATPPTQASELPQTGPEAAPIIAAGALAFSIAAFLRSRKFLFEQL